FSLFYAAVMRGRLMNGSPWIAGLGVWLITMLVTAMSFPQTFITPYILTNGGPINSTTTLPFYAYRSGFVMMRLGYSAAQVWTQMLPYLALALLVWLVMTAFNLRLRFTTYGEAFSRGSLAGLITLPA